MSSSLRRIGSELLSPSSLVEFLEQLMPGERVSCLEGTTVRPQPKQEALLRACGLDDYFWGRGPVREAAASWIGYGGGAYGAKTYGLMILGYTACMAYDGITVAYFRRTYQEIFGPDGAHRKSIEVMGSAAKNREDGRVWEYGNGSKFYFRHAENEQDVYTYSSQSFDILLIDEAGAWTWPMVDYLWTRVRVTSASGIKRPFIVLTANPEGPGFGMYYQIFDLGKDQGEHEQVKLTSNPKGGRQKVYFIPSNHRDNLIGLERDPDYPRRLKESNPDLARALLENDWSVFRGMAFNDFDVSRHVIKPFELPKKWPKWRAVDEGYYDPFCCLWFARDPDTGRVYVYREVWEAGLTDREQARMIAQNSPREEGVNITFAGQSLWARSNTGGIVTSAADEYIKEGIFVMKADQDRLSGKKKVHRMLANLPDGQPALQIFENCYNLIRTLPKLARAKANPEDVEPKGQEDHAYDALRYGLTNVEMFGEVKPRMKGKRDNPYLRLGGNI